MSFGPTGIFIGETQIIAYYGIILMFGALVAAYFSDVRARQRGFDSEIVWDALIWVLVGGIVGARLWHVFSPPPSMVERGITTYFYLTHPLDLVNLRNGGLGIPGAVIGGVLALYAYTRRHKISFAVWADIATPTVALGQAIGRWGNYVNQELYGAPTNLPWAITIDPAHRLPQYANQATYHPLFLYEMLWNLLNMGLLLWVERRYAKKLKAGDLFLFYLIGYPVGRFFLEFLRLDASQVAGINFNQTFMLLIVVFAVAMLVWRHRTPKESFDLTESTDPGPLEGEIPVEQDSESDASQEDPA